jgi:hypothetical protein
MDRSAGQPQQQHQHLTLFRSHAQIGHGCGRHADHRERVTGGLLHRGNAVL